MNTKDDISKIFTMNQIQTPAQMKENAVILIVCGIIFLLVVILLILIIKRSADQVETLEHPERQPGGKKETGYMKLVAVLAIVTGLLSIISIAGILIGILLLVFGSMAIHNIRSMNRKTNPGALNPFSHKAAYITLAIYSAFMGIAGIVMIGVGSTMFANPQLL